MKRVLLILVLMCGSVWSASIDFFVSPEGDDTHPGSRDKPFATLTRARQAVREVIPNSTEEITVWIAGGVYSLDRSFELLQQDSGTAGRRIRYRARPGETVRLRGGKSLNGTDFTPVTDPNLRKRLAPEAADSIVHINLYDQGIADFGEHRQYGHALPVVPAPLELVVNDEMMTLARYPNKGHILIGRIIDTGSVPRIRDYENIRGGTFVYTDDRHARWAELDDIWFQGTFHNGYADDQIKVERIDPETRQVRLASPHMYGLGSGEPFQHYVALNILEELDQPGEWYLDRESGILYLWPTSTLQDADITVTELEAPLVVLDGASYVSLEDITIECSRGIGLYMEGGHHNRINGCTFRNLGTLGILMGQGARQTFPHITHDDYAGEPVSRRIGSLKAHLYKYTTWDRNAGHDHVISRCTVYNTGSGGIYLSGGNKKDLIPGNCVVEQCQIHDYNRRNKNGWAGVIVDGCGNRIVHNEIYNSNWHAIFANGNEHLYEYNHIHHVARNSNDTSAWYTGRDPSDRGTMIRYNFFHHIGRPDRKWTMGVYFDDGICGATVHGNVFYKVASYGSVYSNGGSDITITNNLFIGAYGPAFVQKSMWWDFAIGHWDYYFGENGVYRRRLTQLLDITSPPYSTRYPELVDWLDKAPQGEGFVGMYPKRNRFERNVIVQQGETVRLVGWHANCDFNDLYITLDDPGFVNAETMNFNLKKESAVWQECPGFEAIPFDRIGPQPESDLEP